MKIVVNNLVWLALFSLMACASVYPNIAGIAQSVIWVIVSIIIVVAPLGVVATAMASKERLIEIAGKRKGFIRNTIGWIKLAATFSATAYAGFTVAASFYVLGALCIVLSVHVARYRLKDMEKESV